MSSMHGSQSDDYYSQQYSDSEDRLPSEMTDQQTLQSTLNQMQQQTIQQLNVRTFLIIFHFLCQPRTLVSKARRSSMVRCMITGN